MTLKEFNPQMVWYRSVEEPAGVKFPPGEQVYPHEQSSDSQHLHNGDDWLALEGLVHEDAWTWNGQGNPCDFGRNRVFEITATR